MNDHSKSGNRVDPTTYRSLNMKLLYVATRTRPDILFPTVVCATRSEQPTDIDFQRLVKVLSYLKGTADRILVFKRAGPIYLHAYVDASFNIHWDAKGHNGFCLFVDKHGSACVIIKCGKQKSTADSSTESELMALHEAAKHICWAADVYAELGHDVKPIEIFQDNKSSITLSSEEALNFKGRSKFINRKFFGIYELIQDNKIKLSYVCTEDMIADVLTKVMVGSRFKRFAIALLGCKSIFSSD